MSVGQFLVGNNFKSLNRQGLYKIEKEKQIKQVGHFKRQFFGRMSRLIIVIMEQNEYPFGQCDNSVLEKKKVMVRRRIEFHPFQKKNMLLKAKKIKGFVNPYIIKLEQLLEQDCSLHLLFQYVPIKIQTWITNINGEFIQNFKLQLLQLAQYLAQNSIVIDFRLKNIGMDQNYLPKYFIGLDYQINTLVGKDLLLQKYKTQINQIINPYRVISLDYQKISLVPQLNPQFAIVKCEQTLKRSNQKSANQIKFIKTPVRLSQTQKAQIFKANSIKKMSNLSDYDLKLTFDGSQKVLFDNLPKNISTNIKIEHIGRKINDLKNMINNISGKNVDRRHESVSLSPKKGLNEERPNSSYQKGLLKQMHTNNSKQSKVQKGTEHNEQINMIKNTELRETQSESEYSRKLPSYCGLNKMNEKMQVKEGRGRNEIRVGGGKQSYIYEFERLLNDDIDQFTVNEGVCEVREGLNDGKGLGVCGQKSPRFGFTSGPVSIQNIKTEPERFSYSHNVNRRKKSTESTGSNRSQIQERVNAVIGASKKLINNFRKSRALEKRQYVCKVE